MKLNSHGQAFVRMDSSVVSVPTLVGTPDIRNEDNLYKHRPDRKGSSRLHQQELVCTACYSTGVRLGSGADQSTLRQLDAGIPFRNVSVLESGTREEWPVQVLRIRPELTMSGTLLICPELGALPNRELTAVLDGQQRLTALNIGLRGSMAIKEPNKWRTNPNAFPKRLLYLNLFAVRGEEEEGEAYSFRFRDPDTANSDLDALWYPVSDILAVSNVGKLSQWLHAKLNERNIGHNDAIFNRASDTLHQLYTVIHTAPTIAFYTEKSQELDRVLRIFIRMNSGGTVLSYSDLLLSIAVAQWSKLDARQEIHSLVGSLNKIGPGFNFSKDFVLKAWSDARRYSQRRVQGRELQPSEHECAGSDLASCS